jgi:inner membrane protein
MASIGHIAVGMAAARVCRDNAAPRWSSVAWWSALSMLPDADVIGFALGTEYGDPWGHRGATHSLTVAMAIATLLGLAAPRLPLARFQPTALKNARQGPRFHPRFRIWAIAAAVLVSHGLLDTLTDGGLGCALLWPFDLTRYFAPWRPIPVAPIGLDFLSPSGLLVALTELVLFAPLVVFALRPSHLNKYVLPVWCVSVWLIASGDPVREAAIGFVLREDTEYASGFSDRSFQTIRLGDSDTEVRRLMGAPLGEWWAYRPQRPDGCPVVYFESDTVTAERHVEACARRGVRPGMSPADVRGALGAPAEVCWPYSRSPGGGHYRVRVVCFSDGNVVEIFRQWH